MNTLGAYFRARGLTELASESEGSVWYSEPEIRLAEELAARGLRFVQQVRLPSGGTTVVLDFVVEDNLAVEIDGREFHDPVKDKKRDLAVLREHKLWTLRLPARSVMRDPEACVCDVARQLLNLWVWGWPERKSDAPVAAQAVTA